MLFSSTLCLLCPTWNGVHPLYGVQAGVGTAESRTQLFEVAQLMLLGACNCP